SRRRGAGKWRERDRKTGSTRTRNRHATYAARNLGCPAANEPEFEGRGEKSSVRKGEKPERGTVGPGLQDQGLHQRRARSSAGQEASWASAGILSPAPENPGMIAIVPLGKASLSLYPEFIARVEEISGKSAGFRPKGTLEALFSQDAKAELSTIIALHHGLGLKAEPLRAEDARELEPALSEEVKAAVLRPDEASVDNRALTAAI